MSKKNEAVQEPTDIWFEKRFRSDSPEAPVQEPVNGDKVKQLVSKCTHRDVDGNWYVDGVQLVHETCFALDAIKRKSATPPAAPVPLTDEQREEIAKGWRGRNWTVGDIIDAIEAAHGITKGQQ